MIPLDQLTTAVVRHNMIVTTYHKIGFTVFVVAVLCTIYGIIVGLYVNQNQKKFMDHYKLNQKYADWKAERKKWL